MLRQQTLAMYRKFLRVVRGVDNEVERNELKDWLRHDFQSNKHHTDEEIIKMHLSRGRIALRELETAISLSHSKNK